MYTVLTHSRSQKVSEDFFTDPFFVYGSDSRLLSAIRCGRPLNPEEHDVEALPRGTRCVAEWLVRHGSLPEAWLIPPWHRYGTSGLTVAMELATCHHIPSVHWRHDTEIRDSSGNTVAMMLAARGKPVPRHWLHDPSLRNEKGQTVAMLFAANPIGGVKITVIPSVWRHDPALCDDNGRTVADLWRVSRPGVSVPEEWAE